MAEKAIQFTYDDYLLFPDDLHIHQIIEGEHFMNPSPVPYHQDISRNLLRILAQFVEAGNLGKIYDAPIDVVLSDVNVVVPDLVFISRCRAAIIREKYIHGSPDLVVEILSKGTKKLDQDLKLKLYAKFLVPEYWIIDPENKTASVHRLKEDGYAQPRVFRETEVMTTATFPGLNIPLAEVFRK